MFTCNRCGYETNVRCNLEQHLKRKLMCPPNVADVDALYLLHQLQTTRVRKTGLDTAHKCSTCQKCFATKCSLALHQKRSICNPQESTAVSAVSATSTVPIAKPEIQCIIDELKTMRKSIDGKLEVISTMNERLYNLESKSLMVIQQQNNFIHVSNFGEEDTSHISPELAHDLLLECESGFLKFFKLIYFNDDVPQNRNVRLESKKQDRMGAWTRGEWDSMPRNVCIDKLYTHVRRHYLHRYFTDEEYMFTIREMADSPLTAHIPQFIDRLNDNKSTTSQRIRGAFLESFLIDWRKGETAKSIARLAAPYKPWGPCAPP